MTSLDALTGPPGGVGPWTSAFLPPVLMCASHQLTAGDKNGLGACLAYGASKDVLNREIESVR